MPVRIRSRSMPVADDHRDHGIAAAATAVQGVQGGKYVREA